jgi:hypothetical protein
VQNGYFYCRSSLFKLEYVDCPCLQSFVVGQCVKLWRQGSERYSGTGLGSLAVAGEGGIRSVR